ncbi:MAG TPA: hypothetical protein VIJ14_00120 [Rhabdochlamydiaceae bacterium]
MLLRLHTSIIDPSQILYVTSVEDNPYLATQNKKYKIKLLNGDVLMIDGKEHAILFTALEKLEKKEERARKKRERSNQE